MKFRLPQGATRLSHAGRPVVIAADGSCDLEPGVAVLVAPHGIEPFGDPMPVEMSHVATMTAADLEAALVARGIAIPVDADGPALRALLRRTLAKPRRGSAQ